MSQELRCHSGLRADEAQLVIVRRVRVPRYTHLDAEDITDVVDVRRHDLLYLVLAEGRVFDLIYLQPAGVASPEAVYLDLGSGTCA